MADKAFLKTLERELFDQGKIIEAGWVGLRVACDLHNAPPEQLREMRMAFFAGAQHLFTSIMSVMEPGEEPTEKDLDRMSRVNDELDAFLKDFMIRHAPTSGSA